MRFGATPMKISINGVTHNIEQYASITKAIERVQTNKKSDQAGVNDFVIALNQNFVPRSQYSSTQLRENDAIELLSPMAGG
jgi:thiamine biosynthesis protein ThiS